MTKFSAFSTLEVLFLFFRSEFSRRNGILQESFKNSNRNSKKIPIRKAIRRLHLLIFFCVQWCAFSSGKRIELFFFVKKKKKETYKQLPCRKATDLVCINIRLQNEVKKCSKMKICTEVCVKTENPC